MPATSKGYSSAHFRMDMSIVVDFAEITNSEVAVEIFNISETGADNLWIGVYYLSGKLFLDAPYFNVPKISITTPMVTEFIENALGGLLDEDIYTENELPKSDEGSEASAAAPEGDEADALLLISKRQLTIAISNKLIRTVIDMLAEGLDLDKYITDKILASAQIDMAFDDALTLDANVNFMMEGSRYVATEEPVQEDLEKGIEGSYFFTLYDATIPAHRNRQLYVEKGETFTALAPDAERPSVLYVREKAVAPFKDTVVYFNREEDGAGNLNEYDTDVNLLIAVRDVDVKFTSQHEYHLTAEDLKQYTEITELDRLVLTESIDLTTRFVKGSDIDMTAVLEWLFPQMDADDLKAVISAVSDSEGDVTRKIEVIMSVEIKFGALLNYLRQYGFNEEMGNINNEMGIMEVINVIMGAVQNFEDIDLGQVLSFINASILVQTTADRLVVDSNGKRTIKDTHTLVGIYMESGAYEEMSAEERIPGNADYIAPEYRYSHYFENAKGNYYYDSARGEFRYDPKGNVVGVTRYAYDATYYYKNPNGDYKRERGGLFLDLSGLNMPSFYVNSDSIRSTVNDHIGEVEDVLGGLLGGLLGGNEGNGEAQAAEGGIGETIDNALPLVNDEIAEYITAFIVGARLTSTFVQVVINSNFINEVLSLVFAGSDTGLQFNESDFTKEPYVQINTDRSVYQYESALTASGSNSDMRFYIEEGALDGTYVFVNGVYKSKADLTDAELEEYAGEYYSIKAYTSYLKVLTATGHYFKELSRATAIEKERAEKSGNNFVYYVKAETTSHEDAYYHVGGGKYSVASFGSSAENEYYLFNAVDEADMLVANVATHERKPLASVMIYLWEYELGVNIGAPEISVEGFNYELADSNTPEGDKYYIVPEVAYTFVGSNDTKDEWIVGLDNAVGTTTDGLAIVGNYLDNLRYFYYQGEYYEINSTSLYVVDASGKHVPATSVYTNVDFAGGQMIDFMSTARRFYINISLENLGISRFEEITAGKLYKQVTYRDSYVRADGTEPEGTTYYQRATVENVITRPSHKMELVEMDGARNYVWNWKTNEFVLESALADAEVKALYNSGKLVKYLAEETTLYTYDDWTRTYMPVGEYLATYFTASDWEDANKVDSTCARYNEIALYAQDADEIKYVDSDDMFFISLTIRGGISITGYHDYMSVADYIDLVNSVSAERITEADIDPSLRYRLQQGNYVQDNEGNYVLYSTGVEESLGAVLGGIVGDLDESMIRVLEGFTGELLFEVKINLSYRIDWKPEIRVNIFDLDLAVDVWRRENDGANYQDGTLTHMVGIYYNHDIDTGDAALYLDLSWVLGEGGKFAIDMSAYSIEELIAGLLSGEIALGGGEASTADDGAGLVDATANPALAGVFVNIYTRKLSLAITKGFIEVLLQLLGVDLGEMLPNFDAQVNLTLNPYSTGVNINLYNEDGTKGVLTLGAELQLFNGTENSSAIDFGTMEDFNTRIEIYKGSIETDGDTADNHIFYYGNFVQNENASYDEAYIKIGNAIGELKAQGEVIPEDAVDVGNGIYNSDRKYYVKADTVYTETEFNNAVSEGILVYTRADARLAQVNEDSVFNIVISRQHYIDMLNCWNITGVDYVDSNIIVKGTMEFVEPARRYNIVDGKAVKATDPANFTHIEISTKSTSIYSRYISVYKDYEVINKYYVPAWDKDESGSLYVFTGTEEAPKYADLSDARFQAVTFDAEGVATGIEYGKAYYKVVDDFTDYSTIMSVDLGALISGGGIDVMKLLGELGTVELDMSLSVDLRLSDVINWTEQMTSFLSTELYDYFAFMLASTDWDNGNFGANIGLVIDVKAMVNVQNLLDYVMNGGELIDAIKGIEIYLNVTCTTNYFNENATVEIWMNVDNDGKLNLYMNLEELDKVVGLGNFFNKVKFEGIDLSALLGAVGGEAQTTADTLGLETLGVEGAESETGIIPADLFGIVEMVLGQVLFGHDIIAIGLKDHLLVDLVSMIAEDFDGAEYLPKLEITDDASTSGLVINLGGGAPSIGVNLGFVVGYESYAEVSKYPEYTGVKFNKVSEDSEEYVVAENGTHIMVSSDKYALIEYANNVWTGDRYVLNADGTTFTQVFSEFEVAEDGFTGQRYALKNGQYIADENGTLKKNANTFTANAEGKGGFVMLTAEDLAVEKLTRYAAFGTDGNRYLPVDTYEKLAEKRVATDRATYDITTTGDYLLIGDLSLSFNVYDLGIYTNNDTLKIAQNDNGDYLDVDGKEIVDYADITKSTLNISMAMDLSYYGSAKIGEEDNVIDLSELVDLVFGLVAPSSDMAGSTLRLNITDDMGSADYPSLKIKLGAYLDLNNFGATEIALELVQYDKNGNLSDIPLVAIYLANDNVYVDASTILGETGKIYLGELGLGAMLDDILGGILNPETANGGEAMTASGTVASRLTLHDWAFLQAMIHPQYFSLTLSTATINAIINKIYEEQGKELGDIIPNLGEIMVDAYGYAPVDGVDERPYIASFNIKMSEGFYASAEITETTFSMHKQEDFGTTKLYATYNSANATHKALGEQYAELTAEELVSYEGTRYTKNGSTYTADVDGLFKYVGERYNKVEAGYAHAPAGFDGQRYALVDGDYVTSKDGEYMYVEEHYVRDANGTYIIPYTEAYNVTTGQIGIETISVTLDVMMKLSSTGLTKSDSGYSDTFAYWVENLIVGLLSEIDLLKNTEFVITLPQRPVEIKVAVEADINLPALLMKGIAGILYSDFAINITIDEILPGKNFLAIYYLGSTGLKKSGNVYDLVATTDLNKIFSDALYIDATGLGLGKINFHGFAGLINPINTDPNSGSAGMDLEGLLGGMIASDSEASSTEEASSSATTSGVDIQLDIQDGYIGFKADSSLLDTIISLIGADLGGILDGCPIEEINAGITYDLAQGLGATTINTMIALDTKGTLLGIDISGLSVSINKPLINVASRVVLLA